jgi:hypothetical protein
MNQPVRTPTGILRSRASLTLVLLFPRLQAARLRGDFREVARLTGMIEKNRGMVRERIQNGARHD